MDGKLGAHRAFYPSHKHLQLELLVSVLSALLAPHTGASLDTCCAPYCKHEQQSMPFAPACCFGRLASACLHRTTRCVARTGYVVLHMRMFAVQRP